MRISGQSFVVIGPSITSSLRNPHATMYRSLLRELCRRGHRALFLERDLPEHAEDRDLPRPAYGRTELYGSIDELRQRFQGEVRDADVVLVGAGVAQGIVVGDWVLETARGITAFYDADTPVTLAMVGTGEASSSGAEPSIAPRQIARYRLYLSCTGGPMLRTIESRFRSPRARPFHDWVDPELYFPEPRSLEWDLGYLGTYSVDRQAALVRLLLDPARAWPRGRFIVAGGKYPPRVEWPANVAHVPYVAPHAHRAFYNAQRFTLNVTRDERLRAGWSPSVRLFEAGACGIPVITDAWPGMEDFFEIGREIVLARDAGDVMYWLRASSPEERDDLAARARRRVLQSHTAAHRAEALEAEAADLLQEGARSRTKGARRR